MRNIAPDLQQNVEDKRKTSTNTLRYDTIEEFNVDSKAE